ncbi:hypothetical protein [Hymenobacter wooponensis]|uniref:Uncharacterized protein n=1 Tax=Hymenobacter wooponensis TaxID=1525360 RepID=A0A4Z0MHG7_9BACT|nr:hypothetical protein [Hymenobacter wooponensis]TGD78777.1 hypothetical protein EU557_17500 [Hymenobacter wooponensis]
MLSSSTVQEIIQQLRSDDVTGEIPYLGFFADEQNEEYWHIEANRAGLRKYAADLLTASVYIPPSADDTFNAPLGSSWLDEAGDAQPLFVKFVEAPNAKPVVYRTDRVMDTVWKVGCLVMLVALLGIFAAGIKEIIDQLKA